MNMNYLILQLLISIFMMISVAFYTLLERKVLSYQQNRKGPNKSSLLGLMQPFSDAVKLLTKKENNLTFINNMLYWLPPFYSFFMFICIINLMPSKMGYLEINYSWVIFLCFIALMGFSTILMGWASNSKYTMMGSLRGLAQTISYEVLLIMSTFIILFMMNTMEMNQMKMKNWLLVSFMTLFIVLMLSLSLICEVNRAPFDLAEGESELVSGFNTEFGMTKFSLIFLSEYGMMIFMSLVVCLNMNNTTETFFFIKMYCFMFIFLWLRSSYPRLRYDILMYFTWKNTLSLVIMYSIFLALIL